mmetsp:Transcript_5125/g.19200  ORF Transcript_5125/g.19200 Transcript_5125/m.19200 type:complete len:258 (+) Transcript_5125:1982-2755(+)
MQGLQLMFEQWRDNSSRLGRTRHAFVLPPARIKLFEALGDIQVVLLFGLLVLDKHGRVACREATGDLLETSCIQLFDANSFGDVDDASASLRCLEFPQRCGQPADGRADAARPAKGDARRDLVLLLGAPGDEDFRADVRTLLEDGAECWSDLFADPANCFAVAIHHPDSSHTLPLELPVFPVADLTLVVLDSHNVCVELQEPILILVAALLYLSSAASARPVPLRGRRRGILNLACSPTSRLRCSKCAHEEPAAQLH